MFCPALLPRPITQWFMSSAVLIQNFRQWYTCIYACVCVEHTTTSATGHLAMCWLSAGLGVSVDSSVNRAWPFTPHFICWLTRVQSPLRRNPAIKKSLVLISYLLNHSRNKCCHLVWKVTKPVKKGLKYRAKYTQAVYIQGYGEG